MAIAGFVKQHDLPTGHAAITEIDRLLDLAQSEKELALFLRRDLLCFVQRGREYQTWTNWLRWVQTILHREVTLARARRRLSSGPGTHTLHFPVVRSVGLLQRHDPPGVRIVKRAFSTARYRSWIQEPQRLQLIEPRGYPAPSYPDPDTWEFFCQAQGSVIVPDDIPLQLIINENGGWDPSPLLVREAWSKVEVPRRAPLDLGFLEELPPDALDGLQISNTDLVGSGLGPIKHLTGLRSLVVHQQKVGDGEISLLTAHSHLEVLGLGRGVEQVSDGGLKFLEGCTALRTLVLNGTKVTDRGLGYLRGCTEMEELHLNDTIVGAQHLTWITDMNRLQRLELRNTHVGRLGLARLAKLGSLRRLIISSPHLDIPDLVELHLALPNCRVSNRVWDENSRFHAGYLSPE
jgi:hypothetical protein